MTRRKRIGLRLELDVERHDDLTMLTWIDAVGEGALGRLSMWGAMVEGLGWPVGERFALSTRAGADHWWLPNPECGTAPLNDPDYPERFRCFVGDFTYGAFYFSDPNNPTAPGDGTLRFLAQWPESDTPPTVPIEPASFPADPINSVGNPDANNSLHYSIVRVAP